MERKTTRATTYQAKRKRLLVEKMMKALVPVAKVLLAELGRHLRRSRPGASEAVLLAAYLANPSSEDEAVECRDVLARHARKTGMRLVSHERRTMPGAVAYRSELCLTLRFALDPWERQLAQAGMKLSPVLELDLRSSHARSLTCRLPGIEDLALPALEQAYAVFQNYWLDQLAAVAVPMTGRYAEAPR